MFVFNPDNFAVCIMTAGVKPAILKAYGQAGGMDTKSQIAALKIAKINRGPWVTAALIICALKNTATQQLAYGISAKKAKAKSGMMMAGGIFGVMTLKAFMLGRMVKYTSTVKSCRKFLAGLCEMAKTYITKTARDLTTALRTLNFGLLVNPLGSGLRTLPFGQCNGS